MKFRRQMGYVSGGSARLALTAEIVVLSSGVKRRVSRKGRIGLLKGGRWVKRLHFWEE